MSGSNGSRNGSDEEFREGRVFTFTHSKSGVTVEITYPAPISGQRYNAVEALGANIADFLSTLEAVEEASDCDRASVICIINLLLQSPEEIISSLQESGTFGFVVGFEDEQDELSWTAAQPPANLDVGNN